MRLREVVQTSLGIKVFMAFLLVILVCAGTVLTTADLLMPSAFERHLAAMALKVGEAEGLSDDLSANYRQALVESLVVASLVATTLATVLSFYVSRRMVAPIESMLLATRKIADGNYAERVEIDVQDSAVGRLDELQQLGVAFNRMATTLEKTEKRRQELIGNVVHELRTPLTTIMGYMEGLIDGVVPEDAATYDLVHREAARLRRLVQDLQQLSRLEEGVEVYELWPVAMGQIVERVSLGLEPQFDAKGVSLKVSVAENLPLVMGDEDRLGQVMVNLLGNAMHYTPSGGHVQVSIARKREKVVVEVSDDGIGIAPEHLPHIFERFYRVDPSRLRVGGGTGIGLTVSRHIVAAHGGALTASSEGLGKGSTFRFELNLAGSKSNQG